MKKFILKINTFIFCCSLVACSQTNLLPNDYVVSDATINQYLDKYLKQEQSIGLSGLAEATLAFNKFNVDIGRDDADKVSLSGKVSFGTSTFIGKQAADFNVKVKARPFYEPKEGAIYLKDLELKDFTLGSSFGSINASTLSPYLNSALQFYFNQRPIYTLSPPASVFKEKISSVKVESGKIVFQLNK